MRMRLRMTNINRQEQRSDDDRQRRNRDRFTPAMSKRNKHHRCQRQQAEAQQAELTEEQHQNDGKHDGHDHAGNHPRLLLTVAMVNVKRSGDEHQIHDRNESVDVQLQPALSCGNERNG